MRFIVIPLISLSALGSLAHGATDMLNPVTPTLSPDGSKLVFSWNGDIWISNSAGGDAERLTTHPGTEIYPLFSRDGKTLYFNSNQSGSLQVWKLDLMKRGKPVQVTHHSETTLVEDISPDDSQLYLRAYRDFPGRNPLRLYTQDVEGEHAEKLLFDAYGEDARISPDGSKLLFVREGVETYRKGYTGSQASQVWLYDFSTDEYTQPVKSQFGCKDPVWLPDGSGFYYANGEGGTWNLWKYTFANSENSQLTQFKDDGVLTPTLSRDGSTLIFRRLFHYYKWDPSIGGDGERIQLTHSEDLQILMEKDLKINTTSDADFSGSGLEIVFTANDDLYAMDTVLREPNQITSTFSREYNVVFSKDSQAVFFIQDDGINTKLCKITKKDASKYWWEAQEFDTEVVIDSPVTLDTFYPSPDGKQLAYTTIDGKLWISDINGKDSKVLTAAWDTPSFEWSPDSKWITYAHQNDNFNGDVFLTKADGSMEAVNISQHPDNDFGPTFSPDGKKIAFVGRRYGSSYDIFYVDLTSIGSGKSERAQRIENARKAMKKDPAYKKKEEPSKKAEPEKPEEPKKEEPAKEPKKDEPDTPNKPEPPNPNQPDPNNQPDPKKVPANPQPQPKADPDPDPDDQSKQEEPATKKEEKDDESTAAEDEKDRQEEESPYDLTNIQKRIERIQVRGSTPNKLVWTSDSKSIIFQTSGGKSTYIVEAKEKGATKEYIKATGSPLRMEKGNKLYWVSKGIPSVATGGKSSGYPFTVFTTQNRVDFQRLLFRGAWRTMRDGFYDEHLNGKNWLGMLSKYEHAAASAPSMKDFDRYVAMLLGELNASHTGFRSKPWQSTWSKRSAWKDEVAHFGLIFDPEHQGEGLKVKEVLPTSPADEQRSKIEAGEIILSIDENKVKSDTAVAKVLTGRLSEARSLEVKGLDGETRSVEIQPISFGEARELAAENNIEKTREMVEKLSNGRLGYIHIARMMWDEFEKFERHLYENGAGKDGLIIDVRDNGGGFTTDHLLTALTQPRHAFTIPRNGGPGYPQDRFVYATWDKPIIVLCNQNSFSNAEIFSHAIKTLNRGKLVGVQTAGGVISAGQVNVLGYGSLRYPFRGWFVIDSGKDMELNGAKPDFEIWPMPGEIPAGIDHQLEKAVEVLTKEIKDKPSQFPKAQYHNR
ncbi:tol-Pal system protein TolB [Rubritalea halochordaticola]|uniref:Tricorn protease homolog n=1 Tax=Rubritalea halochordaticola TaxID=714537 RepID=A0ABP9V0J7_9BACT